ncbi:hypothetical protein GCM10023322_72560 [Rugosimonospora acidiphila]|uniref:Uncharacterized protein n=1 Tax=Rugosimonospora acidiphila TaxID=556531 RepID=A0ABP9SQ62_9ACTN
MASAVEPAENPVNVYPVALLNAGPICFSIRSTSEPAYSTLTGPEPFGMPADDGAPDGVDADELDESDELDEQPATATTPASSVAAAAPRNRPETKKPR